jgi:hypothetical protein
MRFLKVNSQRTTPILFLLMLTLLCLPGVALAQAKTAAKPKGPITPEELVKLMSSFSDEAVHGQITARGLAFEPEIEGLGLLFEKAVKQPKDLPRTADALRKLAPAAIAPELAHPQIEQLLASLSASQAASLEVLDMLHPQLLEDKGKVMSVFDPQRYRKHSVGKARALPGSARVGAALFVFTVDGIEKLHFAQFAPTKAGKLLLRDLSESNAKDATFHLGAELDLAKTRMSELYRGYFDNRPEVAQNVMTPALGKSLEDIGGWRRIFRGERVAQGSLQIEERATIDQKSIRPVLRISHPAKGKMVEYYADFERIGGDLRIVRLRDSTGEGVTGGRDIAADPELDLYLCRRYESSGCGLYTMSPSEMPEYATLVRLQSMAEAAIQDFQGDRLKAVAEEMRISFVGDEDPRGLAYLASATFLEMKFPEAEQMALQAVAKGATVYFPVLHFFIPKMGEPWFGRAMFGISRNGLEYVPSADISQYPRYTVPWKDVDKVVVGAKVGFGPFKKAYPFLGFQVKLPRPDNPSRMAEENWNFAIFPSGCAASGSQVRDDMVPWSDNPCKNTASVYPFGESPTKGKVGVPIPPVQSGGIPGIPGGGQSQATTMLMVHKTWQPAEATLQRLILTVKGGSSS